MELPQLAKKLPVDPNTLRLWRGSAGPGAAIPGAPNRWLIWADADELDRLRRLRDFPHTRSVARRYPGADDAQTSSGMERTRLKVKGVNVAKRWSRSRQDPAAAQVSKNQDQLPGIVSSRAERSQEGSPCSHFRPAMPDSVGFGDNGLS